MIIIPNVDKENSCLDCPVWSLCWDSKPTEDICKDRCPIVEPKHGKWIKDEFGSRCNACGLYAYRDRFDRPWESPYCPICGAKMDEDK